MRVFVVYTSGLGDSFNIDEVFTTEDEAKSYCDDMNKRYREILIHDYIEKELIGDLSTKDSA